MVLATRMNDDEYTMPMYCCGRCLSIGSAELLHLSIGIFDPSSSTFPDAGTRVAALLISISGPT